MSRLSDDLFRAAFVQSAACKLVYAPDGQLIYLSPGLYRLLDYRPEDIAAQHLADFCHPADAEREREQLRRVLAGDAEAPIEKRMKNRRGEWIWVQQLLTAIWTTGSAAARVQCLIADIRDIRSRKQTETAHDDQRARLLVVEAMAQLGSWQVNIETGQFWLSDTCCRLLGHEPGQLEPGPLKRLSFIHPQDRKLIRQRLAWAREAGPGGLSPQNPPAWLDARGDISAEFRLLRPSGELRYVTVTARPAYSEQNRLIRLTGFLLDTTAFHLKQQLLQDAHALLQRQNQQLRELSQLLLTSLKSPLSEAERLLERGPAPQSDADPLDAE